MAAAVLMARSKDEAVAKLRKHGVCCVGHAVGKAECAALASKCAADLACAEGAVAARAADAVDVHEATRCARGDFAEYVKRDGGRVDLRCAPFYDGHGNPFFFPVVQAALGGGPVVLLATGAVVAKSGGGGGDQRWHRDGDFLFEDDEDGGGFRPAHALTVFVPLVDLDATNGPTEFRLGSHVRGASGGPEVAAAVSAGTALLFDYRVKHRGLANASRADRPVLFFAFARPWFRDASNGRSATPLFPGTFRRFRPRRLGGAGAVDAAAAAADDDDDDRGEVFEVLFELAVDLGDGAPASIRVRSGDDPSDLAAAFCRERGLGAAALEQLAAAIEAEIDRHAAA